MNQTERLNEILKQLIYSGVIRNQREFGEKLGYKPSFTSQVLKGYRVPSDLPDKIRQVFGIVWDDWDHGERQKTTPPGEKPGGEEDILPDPTKPGIYRDLIQGIIRNSDALVRLTDAMLEERQSRPLT